MCGIAGIISFRANYEEASHQIGTMSDLLVHRGPDDHGYWFSDDRKVYFAHRRLAIIDITKHGHQPMMACDGNLVLVFNGEIYNYLELRAECIALGSVFKTNSDTEVLLESYLHWGLDAFRKLRGMWALALYDKRKNTVVFSRDPFSIKPFYYGLYRESIYFASEPQALASLNEYFSTYDPITSQLFLEHGYLERDSWTFYKNIKRFPHAHYCVIDLNQSQQALNPIRYWCPSSKVDKNLSFNDAADKLRDLFKQSVSMHLRSDAAIGSCLSGGIDSSAIVCVGTELLKGSIFKTFTTHYPHHQALDESAWAKKVIEATGATSYFIEPTKESFLRDLDHLIKVQGEPFGSLSIYAQYCVFKKIAETNVKVVLDGQGADEMFGGYLGFIPYYFEQLTQERRFFRLTKELLSFRNVDIPAYDVKKQLKKLWAGLINNAHKVYNNHETLNQSEIQDELESRLTKLRPNFHSFEERLEDLLCDSNIPQLLRYEDRNSMAFSIESRVPFLVTDIVDFALSLPAEYKIRSGYTKAVFRKAMEGLIPEDIRLRRDKLGFPAPEVQWLKDCFGINAVSTGSLAWRTFILDRWRSASSIHVQKKISEPINVGNE